MADEKPDVGSAYALGGVDEVRALYRDWAQSYDTDFIARMGYVMPGIVASVLRREGGEGPVLDVGCGSGAVGVELAGYRVDGLDLSPEMLAVATAKGVYTRLVEGDLLARLPLEDGAYQSVVSAGTFTHGHVGPEALDELARVAAPGALFCLGINAEHYGTHGFADKLSAMEAAGAITTPVLEDHPIYAADHDRAGDRALVAVFRRG